MITYFDNAARGNEYVMFQMHVSTTRRHMKSSSRLNLFQVKMKYLAFILKAVERNIRQKKKKKNLLVHANEKMRGRILFY